MKKYYWLIAGIVSAFVFLGILSFFSVPAPKPGEFAWLHIVVFLATVLGMLTIISLTIFLSSEKMAGEDDVIFTRVSLYSPDETECIIGNPEITSKIVRFDNSIFEKTYSIDSFAMYIYIPKAYLKKILVTYSIKKDELTISADRKIKFPFLAQSKVKTESFFFSS